MIREIENRRSIRKYKANKINKELIEDMIYSATLAPSAKNRQPWKFIVYQGKEKEKLVDVMLQGINSEKITHALMKEWAFAIPDAENTVRIMEEAPCLIAVLNTNQKTPRRWDAGPSLQTALPCPRSTGSSAGRRPRSCRRRAGCAGYCPE